MKALAARAARFDRLVQLAEFERIATSVENALTDVHPRRPVVTSPLAKEEVKPYWPADWPSRPQQPII